MTTGRLSPIFVATCSVLLIACGSKTKDSPVAPSTTRQSVQFSGTVSNSVTGIPVAGVQLSISGETIRFISTSDGSYSFSGDLTAGPVELVAEAAGYWTRRTAISPSSRVVDVDLLPQGDGFDLTFFNRVMRSGGATRRLTATPTFTVFPQLFECVVPSTPTSGCNPDPRCGGGNTGVRVVGDVEESMVSDTRAVIEQDLSQYTGGLLHDAVIRMGDRKPTGSTVDLNTIQSSNDIAFVFVEKVGCAGTADGIGTTGKIVIQPSSVSGVWREFRRGTISHEMAHMLGFNHTEGLVTSVNCSIMGGDCSNNAPAFLGRPSPGDMLHGRILYKRPRGNTTPDTSLTP